MFREQSIALRVGQANPQLDALLLREGLETAACVEGAEGLAEALHEQGYAEAGGSVLIVGLPRGEARELGVRLGRRAVIFHQWGRETELVFVG